MTTVATRREPGHPDAADSRLPKVEVFVDERTYTVTLDVSELVDVAGFARILAAATQRGTDLAADWRLLQQRGITARESVDAANRIRRSLGVGHCFTVTLRPEDAHRLGQQLDEASEEPDECGNECTNLAEPGETECAMHLADR